MTADDPDVSRLHRRIDELFKEQKAHGEALAEIKAMLRAQAQSHADEQASRQQTCPWSTDIADMARTLEMVVKVGKWVGGVLAVAILIPSVAWAGRQMWIVLIGH